MYVCVCVCTEHDKYDVKSSDAFIRMLTRLYS